MEKTNFKCLLENKEIFETEAFIGRNGFTKDKTEGDGKTPIGVYKTGFVSLMKCNSYAEKEFINFNDLFSHLDDNFFPGHHFYSREYCECVDGIYLTKHHKLVEYYARMIKDCECPYTTQLVYTSDNKVTAGFGKKVLLK